MRAFILLVFLECPRIGPWRSWTLIRFPTYRIFLSRARACLLLQQLSHHLPYDTPVKLGHSVQTDESRYLVAFARPYQTARALRASYVTHYACIKIYVYVSHAKYTIDNLTEVRR